MQDLITIVENEPRVSHRVVAEQTDNKQKNIAELIHKYREDFDEFGTLPFKTEGVINNGQGEQPKTHYLNEPQATFLMTLLRNKPIVVEFKKRLVKEFYEQKEQLQTPATDLTSVMLEMMKNQQRQTDALIDLTTSVIEMVQQPMMQQLPVVEKINLSQRKKIRDLISKKVNKVSVKTGMDRQTIAPGIYIAFKNEFNLDEYGELPSTLYDEAMLWLQDYEPYTKYRETLATYPFGGDKTNVVKI